MLIVHKFRAYMGLLLAFIAGFCPMLKVPIKGNWNLYQTDTRLFFITYGLLGICAFFLMIRKLTAFRMMVIVLFFWYILALAGVYFQVNNYFGSKFVDKLLAKTIHFQWGWIVLLVGILFLMFSVKRNNSVTPKG